jgi:hypothetical protein
VNVLKEKLREVLFSVLPITAIILILSGVFWAAGNPFPLIVIVRFLVGALLVITGLSVFLLGVDLGVTPLSSNIGKTVSKSNRLWVLIIIGLVTGFFICIAEPDLSVLAQQVAGVTSGAITKTALLVVVSVGIAVMFVLGLIRIVYNIPLYLLLTIIYAIILIISLFSSPEILAVSFDASGATTGALTVPFILGLGLGVSGLKKNAKNSEKDSFGLVGITSTGAIFGVLILGMCLNVRGLTGALPESETHNALRLLLDCAKDSAVAMLPLLIIFIAFQVFAFKLTRHSCRRIIIGLIYNCCGLILFLTGVNIGFMDIGVRLGQTTAALGGKGWTVALGFIIGFAVILAEPAVYVLTRQIEEVTAGYVRRGMVLGTLAVGVGLAVGLSMLRISVPEIRLWHYLLPGFALAVGLSFFCPKLFVGIGFDSGGVASGPMTATFVLAFSQGAAATMPGADVLQDAFGMIAMVATMPIIALEILGIIFKVRSKKSGVKKQ